MRIPLTGTLLLAVSTGAQGTPPADRWMPRICVTEQAAYYADPPKKVRTRLELYEDLGVEVLRVQTGWEQGALIDELKQTDLRIKLILYVLGVPHGYSEAHPGEAMVDQHGVADWHLGPWHSEFQSLVTASAEAQMARLRERGILDRIDEVCADLGPAAEGIYPANWTLGREGEEAFWCYSLTAEADFRRAMREQYGTIDAANEAWRLEGERRFDEWANVAIPQPGTEWARGPFWNDMLTWYRDSKRRMMERQIDNTLRVTQEYLGDRAEVIVYLPGYAYSQAEWDAAVATASGSPSIRLMMDNDWLMELALEKGCTLQYTGVENAGEVARIHRKLRALGHEDCRIMWGENAGVESSGRDPLWLAEVIAGFGLRGIDYTWSNWLFEEDRVTPSATYPLFVQAVDALRLYGRTGEVPDSSLSRPGEAREVAEGTYELTASADTRLMGSYPEHVKGWDPEIAVVEGGQSQRMLLRFPVELLPEAGTVASAELTMRGNIDYGDEAPAEIHIYRIAEAWQERGATWLDRTLREAWQTPGGDAVGCNLRMPGAVGAPEPYASASVARLTPGGTVQWDVTDLVGLWRSGRRENHGLMLALAPGASGNRSFCSREHANPALRPKLTVRLHPGGE